VFLKEKYIFLQEILSPIFIQNSSLPTTNAHVAVAIFLHTIFYELTLAADFRKLVLGATAALSKAFVDAFLVRFAPGVTTIDVCFPKVGDRLAKADLADDDEAFFAIRFVDS